MDTLRNLTAVEWISVVGSVSSTIALTVWLFKAANNRREAIQERRKHASEDFDAKFEMLQAAGASVSARTDLSMFVQIELGALYGDLHRIEHAQTRYFISWLFVGLTLLFGIVIRLLIQISEVSDISYIPNVNFSGVAALLMFAHLSFTYQLFRLLKDKIAHLRFIRRYEYKAKRIWADPVAKRLKKLRDDAQEEK